MARVLVVDDAAFMRKMVSDALTKGGHEVVGEAGNGVEAVERYQELKPDLTTLDITMPEKDGLDRPQGDHRARPGRPGHHVLGAGPGVQGARVRQARREGLRRQAVPGRSRPGCRQQGARLARAPCPGPGARRASIRPLGWDHHNVATAYRAIIWSPVTIVWLSISACATSMRSNGSRW